MDRRLASLLFVLFLLIYGGTARGVLEEVDDVAMLRLTQSIVRQGSVAVTPDTPGSSVGVDGRSYTRYGVGQSLLGIPFYVLGSLLPAEVETADVYDPHGFVLATPLAAAMTGLDMMSTAAAVALLFLTCRALGCGQATAVASAFEI